MCPGAHSFQYRVFLNVVWCNLVARIMESTFDTTLTPLSSTSEGFKQRSRWRLISSTSFCSPVTVHWTLLPKQHAKQWWQVLHGLWQFLAKPSAHKRQVMYQPAPGKPYVKHNITIKEQQLKVVEKFTYLGSNLSKSIVILFTNPSTRAGYDTRSIFKRSFTGLNSEFSFS